MAVGCDGVVASGLEAIALKRALDDRLLIVSPGIRPVENIEDQKRVVGVEQALKNGADYIVVGRPIRNADDPRAASLLNSLLCSKRRRLVGIGHEAQGF